MAGRNSAEEDCEFCQSVIPCIETVSLQYRHVNLAQPTGQQLDALPNFLDLSFLDSPEPPLTPGQPSPSESIEVVQQRPQSYAEVTQWGRNGNGQAASNANQQHQEREQPRNIARVVPCVAPPVQSATLGPVQSVNESEEMHYTPDMMRAAIGQLRSQAAPFHPGRSDRQTRGEYMGTPVQHGPVVSSHDEVRNEPTRPTRLSRPAPGIMYCPDRDRSVQYVGPVHCEYGSPSPPANMQQMEQPDAYQPSNHPITVAAAAPPIIVCDIRRTMQQPLHVNPVHLPVMPIPIYTPVITTPPPPLPPPSSPATYIFNYSTSYMQEGSMIPDVGFYIGPPTNEVHREHEQ